MSVEVATSPPDTSHHESMTQMSTTSPKTAITTTTTTLGDQQEPITKDSGLLLNDEKFCQDSSSDNKSSSVILKKIIKKPPPIFIDIQNKRSTDDLHQLNNNTPQQNKIVSPLKSPTESVRVLDLGHLDNDEQVALEEEIRARRLVRRQHKKTYADDDEDEDVALTTIGTRVAEGHRNYQMMYDMLTGIRIAVGRVSAKIQRDLTPDDFTAAHKLVFDV